MLEITFLASEGTPGPLAEGQVLFAELTSWPVVAVPGEMVNVNLAWNPGAGVSGSEQGSAPELQRVPSEGRCRNALAVL